MSSRATAPPKAVSYYTQTREDIVAALPRPLGRVLDVGCGAGRVGPGLRAAGATELIGVEIEPEVADRAREVYDNVQVGSAEAAVDTLEGPFQTILCLDVLEHLVDPAPVLTGLLALAAPGAHLQVSVPNARHVSLLRDLALRGTFGYADWGHRDYTHLRWFTRRDIVAAIAAAGWEVTGVSHPTLRRSRLLHRLTAGRSTEFLVGQWYVGARRPVP